MFLTHFKSTDGTGQILFKHLLINKDLNENSKRYCTFDTNLIQRLNPLVIHLSEYSTVSRPDLIQKSLNPLSHF